MQPWSQKVEQSQALADAKNVRTTIANLSGRDYSVEERDFLDRLDLVAGQVIDRLERVDPRLITDGMLNSLAQNSQNMRSYLDTWVSNQAPDYLRVHAQSAADGVLGTLSQLPVPVDTSEQLSSLRRSVSGHRLAVKRELDGVESQVQQVESNYKTLLAAAQGEIDALTKQVSATEAQLQAVQNSTRDLSSQQQAAFTKAETDRSEAFSRLLSDEQVELEKKTAQMKSDVSKFLDDTRNDLSKKQTEADQAKERIEKILQIVSEDALIADYSKNASKERRAAFWLRFVAILLLISAAGVAAHLAGQVGASNFSWKQLVAKLFVTITLSGVAGYCAQQSSEHRRAQRAAERMSLQLAAIKPYLEDITDKEKRDELLLEIARRLFGQEELNSPVDDKALSNVTSADPALLQQILAILNVITKFDTKGKN